MKKRVIGHMHVKVAMDVEISDELLEGLDEFDIEDTFIEAAYETFKGGTFSVGNEDLYADSDKIEFTETEDC